MLIWTLYIVFIIGLLIGFSTSIQIFLNELKAHTQSIIGDLNHFAKSQARFKAIFAATLGEHGADYLETYGFAYFILCGSSFVFFLTNLPIIQALQSTLLVIIVPLAYLRTKLYTIRIESSYEGEFLISELMNQYKINHYNMIEALDHTVVHLKNTPRVKALLFSLSLQVKAYRDEAHLDDILETFNYMVDTQWSRMLINNIRLSIHEGLNVTSGLADIQDELRHAKKSYEKSERSTTEGFVMVKFLIPGLYGLTIFLAIRLFGFTLIKFIHYQFLTPTGLRLIMICSGLYFLNLFIMLLFKKRKFDIT